MSMASLSRADILRLVRACAGFLAISVVLGAGANLLRPASSRLPWIGDWSHHVETLAFRAGVPVAFLNGARERVADPETVVFDARKPSDYAAGHLPGARSLPVADVDARIVDYVHLLEPETPILVYCGSMTCTDALDLAIRLRGFGFENATIYPGGYDEWVGYGGEIRTGGAP
jgi:rhodanese-related sulfurtransferase